VLLGKLVHRNSKKFLNNTQLHGYKYSTCSFALKISDCTNDQL